MSATTSIPTSAAVLLIALALTACGGGGGGGGGGAAAPPSAAPNVARAPDYTPGSTHASYRIGATDSFYMAGCTGSCYRDADGNLFDIRDSGGSVYPNGVVFLHRRLQGSPGPGEARISVPEPPRDVRQAWRDGWTGQGVNMLIVDEFGSAATPPARVQDDRHGYTVLMSALETARGATFYALEAGIGTLRYGAGGVRNQDGTTASASTKFHVVNHSFGLLNPSPTGDAPTRAEVDAEVADAEFRDLLGGRYRTEDAVITFAAGNNGMDTGRFADAVALATHRGTSPRVLIVGALDGYARTSNPQSQSNIRTDARLASYSNRAGSNAEIQRRFLVEYGGRPYGRQAGLCDAAVPVSQPCSNPQTISLTDFDTRGTSFSAPRVAGFAALVRDKFPNLSGAHTANILLETATTLGLACHTGSARKSASCARNIYGQGRVDIGAALAPIGSLR
ncbi:MAG: S8 family serine peptidase [Gammaproteobacteria bacterium]|nr:S8 family serine peptidase [Gammaproteobacteria bacterium]